MNICVFTENSYKGGLDTFIINLFNSWPMKSDSISLLCNENHPGLDTISEKTKIPVSIIKYNRFFSSKLALGQSKTKFARSFPVRAFFGLSLRILQYPVLFPWYVLSLTFYFRYSHFDRLIIVNGGYPASLLCRSSAIAWKISGKKELALFNFHNSATKPPRHYSLPEYIIDALVEDSVKNIVSVSENCLNTIKVRKAFAKSVKLKYIHNGIQDLLLEAPLANMNLNLNYKSKYCLMLATLEPRKGHSFLLHSFKSVIEEYPDVQLYIYGDGRDYEKQHILNEIRELKLEKNVFLYDFISDTASLIMNSSLLLMPSQAYESFGMTIIEAMSLHVPVVVTDVGGMPEVLAGSNAGYVCEKDNPRCFSESIIKILSNSDLAVELGNNGRKTFEQKYTAKRMAEKYYELLM